MFRRLLGAVAAVILLLMMFVVFVPLAPPAAGPRCVDFSVLGVSVTLQVNAGGYLMV